MVQLAGINRTAFLLGHQIRNGELFFLRLDDHDLADLTSGQRVYDWQVLLENAELLTITRVGSQLDQEFVNCFGVGFAVDQHHSSSDRIWLLFKPLSCVVQWSNGQGTNLSAFCELNWYSEALNRYDFHSPECAFHIWSNVKDLTSLD